MVARVIGLLVTAAVGVGCLRVWKDAEGFGKGLSCGMTVDDIRQYAARFEGTVVFTRQAGNLAGVVVAHGDTQIECWMEKNGLSRYEITWLSAPAKREVGPVVVLCAAEGAERVASPAAESR